MTLRKNFIENFNNLIVTPRPHWRRNARTAQIEADNGGGQEYATPKHFS
jgi:hypothetical protein